MKGLLACLVLAFPEAGPDMGLQEKTPLGQRAKPASQRQRGWQRNPGTEGGRRLRSLIAKGQGAGVQVSRQKYKGGVLTGKGSGGRERAELQKLRGLCA